MPDAEVLDRLANLDHQPDVELPKHPADIILAALVPPAPPLKYLRLALEGGMRDRADVRVDIAAGIVADRTPQSIAVAMAVSALSGTVTSETSFASTLGASTGVGNTVATQVNTQSPRETVPAGTTVFGLAEQLSSTSGISQPRAEEQILADNGGVNPLMHGRTIRVPAPLYNAGHEANNTRPGHTMSEHRIKSGDTIWGLAKKADSRHVDRTVKEIEKMNGNPDPTKLQVGATLLVPQSATIHSPVHHDRHHTLAEQAHQQGRSLADLFAQRLENLGKPDFGLGKSPAVINKVPKHPQQQPNTLKPKVQALVNPAPLILGGGQAARPTHPNRPAHSTNSTTAIKSKGIMGIPDITLRIENQANKINSLVAHVADSEVASITQSLGRLTGMMHRGGSPRHEIKSASNTLLPARLMQAINRLKPAYMKAAEKTGVPWQVLAAIHYREAENNPGSDLQAGNPLGGGGNQAAHYPGGRRPISIEESAVIAANELKADAKALGSPINVAHPDADALKNALFSYNGRAKAYADQAAARHYDAIVKPYMGSPYVMNEFPDGRHHNMKVITHDYGPADGIDNRIGAYTLYRQLGGPIAQPKPKAKTGIGGLLTNIHIPLPGGPVNIQRSPANKSLDNIGTIISSASSSINNIASTLLGGTGPKPHQVNIVWPFAHKNRKEIQRPDQGRDLIAHAGAPVYAISGGTLHKSNPNPGAFGNDYPTQTLDKSIGGPSKYVYYGHVHILKRLIGRHVLPGQLIAHTNRYYGENGSAARPGWLELGFAKSTQGDPVAAGTSSVTAAGMRMSHIILSAPPAPKN